MGTRGAWGFVINGVEKLTYNHFDSYYSGLGIDLLTWARGQDDWDKVRERVLDLTVVDEQDKPTPEQWGKVAEFADTGVGTGVDWYSALRQCQGDPEKTLDSGYMTDGHLFPLDSLFCEFAYVFNLDDGTFEVYRGSRTEPTTAGRWKGRPTAEEDNDDYARHVEWCKAQTPPREPWMEKVSRYKAVQLVEVWPLHDLPTVDAWAERLGDF